MYTSMTFFVLDLVLIFVNAPSIISGVFKVAFCTNENTVNNNNNDDYLKASNNPNTSQSSSANTNSNNSKNNNNKNNSKDIHRTSVWRDTTILISNASFVNDEKQRKHLSSNGVASVTGTSATTTDGNCTNSSINTINDNINDTNNGSNIPTKEGFLASTNKTVNSYLNLNDYKSNTQSELGVSSFVAATLVVPTITLDSVHSGNNGITSINTAEKSCDLLILYALLVTIVSLSGISSTISTVSIETCTKGNTAKQKQNTKKWFDAQNTRKFPNRFPKNSIVNSNDKRYRSNIDNKNVSKVTYNVKRCQECLEIIKLKVG